MADFTACAGTDCPRRLYCRRYTVTLTESPPYRQSYFAAVPWEYDTRGEFACAYYWPLRPAVSSDSQEPRP